MKVTLKSAIAMAAGVCVLSCANISLSSTYSSPEVAPLAAGEPRLLTDPFLQNPSKDGVHVVWVTNFPGSAHTLLVEDHPMEDNGGQLQAPENSGQNRVLADTAKLNRFFEDSSTRWDNPPEAVVQRQAYRHEAYVDGLLPGKKYRYWVKSSNGEGEVYSAGPFTLKALPENNAPLQILLTSDQQERFNTLANYQTVAEMFPNLDAIFFAGDLANHPRRASEWFDNFQSSWLDNPLSARPSFFPTLQGKFDEFVPGSPYKGGELMQHVALFPSIANHEVSGRFRPNQSVMVNGQETTMDINGMFGDAQPRWYATYRYQELADTINPSRDPAIKDQWIRDNSNDFDAYRELFTLPSDSPEGEAYYVKRVGDVLLISMNVSRIWRNWNLDTKSKFNENPNDLNNPEEWGFGEHLFTPFTEGTAQYKWLRSIVNSDGFKNSKYRVVMFHQSASGLGDNVVPVLTDPMMEIDYQTDAGEIKTRKVLMPQEQKSRIQVWREQVQPLLGSIVDVRYEYPVQEDFFRRDIEPMLQAAGVQLVLHGHSHIWNRVQAGNMHYLETSAAGNCFGAYWTTPEGTPWNDAQRGGAAFFEAVANGEFEAHNYPRTNDPHAREPIMPSMANPMVHFGLSDYEVPFVCSNDISTFTILDTGMGAVRSFALDATDPDSEVIEFDRFELNAK